ncbi:MAG: hypothetical protein IT461_04145 [Planctomycetes bacterium]|nr:hypothetical protein [Planctomycetota bacterium]
MTNDFEKTHSNFSGLDNGLAALGYRTVSDFLLARPTEGYLKLSKELALAAGYGDVSLSAAAIHYRHLMEALRANGYECALADSLVRCIQDGMPREGWGEGPHAEHNIASVSANWQAKAELVAEDHGLDIEGAVFRAWLAIETSKPPVGWKPTSGADPIIRNALANSLRGVSLRIPSIED